MPTRDPAHWLLRLTAAEWLAAAETELVHAEAALTRRAARTGVTHARRAAGMAWNAVLAAAPDPEGPENARYGRSYMDHVVALASSKDEDDAPAEVRAAAQRLRDTAPRPPELVTIGKPDLAPLEAARTIVAYATVRSARTVS
jgi:hypothetical protein